MNLNYEFLSHSSKCARVLPVSELVNQQTAHLTGSPCILLHINNQLCTMYYSKRLPKTFLPDFQTIIKFTLFLFVSNWEYNLLLGILS